MDRDDDLGGKAEVATPLVGRRRVQEAAAQLGIADPEDSDVNALFAAINLYDRELRAGQGSDRQVEVAVIAGHRLVGLRSDRLLAKQLEDVLEATRADEVVLVSDGAEDEQILPILSSRVKVAHVHRSIVKQAPRLEGFYHVLMRMLDDDKLAKRYVLPLGIILFIWGVAVLTGYQYEALGLTLGVAGLWLIVHAMHWEDRLSRFFGELAHGVRTGQVTILTDVAMLVLVVLGAYRAWQTTTFDAGRALQVLTFAQTFLLYFVSALMVHHAGRLVHDWARTGRAQFDRLTTMVGLVAFGFIGSAGLELAVRIRQDEPLTSLLTFDLALRILAGLCVAVGGALIGKYLRGFVETPQAGPR